MTRRTFCSRCENITEDDTRFKCHCENAEMGNRADGVRLLVLSGCACGDDSPHYD